MPANYETFETECYLQEVAALDGQAKADYMAALLSRADSIESGAAEFQKHTVSRKLLAKRLRLRAKDYAKG